MSQLADICDALADQIVAELETGFVEQVTSRMNFDPTPPSIDVFPADPFRRQDEGGFGDVFGAYLITVRCRVTTADHVEGAQDTLLELLDDSSANCLASILEGDQVLNGLTSSIAVETVSGYQQFIDSGNQGALLGVQWGVAVIPAQS